MHADRHALKGDSVPADSSTATTTSYISQDLSQLVLCSEPDEHILVSLLSPSLWLPAACCLIAACCLLPAAYLLPRLVPPLPPQSPDPGASTSNRVLTVHVRVLARLAGRGRWYSPVWYLPWMVASVSPYASPSPPAAPASLRHAMLFAIAAYSSALPLLASLLPVCMFELNTPLQLVLLSMSFFHPYIRTPP